MAQTAGLLAFSDENNKHDANSVIYFAGIDGARFKRPVEPGDQLVMDVEILRHKAGIYKFKAVARVGEDVACEAELMCTMRSVA
jgi:3-hydroxyacyl-[acyl-carrier-protein] dehydratase